MPVYTGWRNGTNSGVAGSRPTAQSASGERSCIIHAVAGSEATSAAVTRAWVGRVSSAGATPTDLTQKHNTRSPTGLVPIQRWGTDPTLNTNPLIWLGVGARLALGTGMHWHPARPQGAIQLVDAEEAGLQDNSTGNYTRGVVTDETDRGQLGRAVRGRRPRENGLFHFQTQNTRRLQPGTEIAGTMWNNYCAFVPPSYRTTNNRQTNLLASSGLTLDATAGAIDISATGPTFRTDFGTTAGALAFAATSPTFVNPTITATAGALTITGGTATLTISLAATAGALAFAGTAPTLKVSLAATAGTLTFAGTAPTFTTSLPATAGTLTFAATGPTFRIDFGITAGLLTFAGGVATFSTPGSFPATAGAIDIAGTAPTFVKSFPATAGAVTLDASGPAVTLAFGIVAGVVTFAATAPNLTISSGVQVGTVYLWGVYAPTKALRAVYGPTVPVAGKYTPTVALKANSVPTVGLGGKSTPQLPLAGRWAGP